MKPTVDPISFGVLLMFTTTFVSLTACCCWFGCWKPAPRPPVVVAPLYRPVVVAPPMYRVVSETPPAKEKSLYDRLGGEAAIKLVIDDFVGRAAGDPKVNFTRKGTALEWKPTPENVDHLKKMLVDLVGMVSDGPQKYTGRSMKEAHKGMAITQAEFDALAGHLKASLDKFKVPAKEQEELLKVVAGTAPDIVEK